MRLFFNMFPYDDAIDLSNFYVSKSLLVVLFFTFLKICVILNYVCLVHIVLCVSWYNSVKLYSVHI